MILIYLTKIDNHKKTMMNSQILAKHGSHGLSVSWTTTAIVTITFNKKAQRELICALLWSRWTPFKLLSLEWKGERLRGASVSVMLSEHLSDKQMDGLKATS